MSGAGNGQANGGDYQQNGQQGQQQQQNSARFSSSNGSGGQNGWDVKRGSRQGLPQVCLLNLYIGTSTLGVGCGRCRLRVLSPELS